MSAVDPASTLAPTAGVVTWTTLAGSAKGSAHLEGVPNQDACATRETALPGGARVLIAAVADGHGGRRYVRSDTGSRLAVDAALDAVEDALLTGSGRRLATILRDATPHLVQRWRDAVQAHVAQHPFTSDEKATAQSTLADDPHISYGSTLIIAIARGTEVALAQLGDGDAVVRVSGSTVDAPIPGDERLVAGETTSLCLATAVQDFRYAELSGPLDCDLVLLASDGYGNSFAAASWRAAVLTDLAEVLATDGTAEVAQRLPGWLAESALVGGDDVTVTLLVRSPLAGASEEPVTGSAPEDHVQPATADPPARRRTWRRAVATLALLALLALAVFLVRDQLADHDNSPTKQGPSSTSVSTAGALPAPHEGARP